MATASIKVKRSAVAGRIPATTDLQLGEIAINTYDGVAYIKKNVNGTETVVNLGGTVELSQNLQNRYQYTATSNQTTFAAVYLAPFVDVFLNGVKLVAGVDYTATNGTSIVLTAGATAGNILDIVAYTTYTANANYADFDNAIVVNALGYTPYNATNPSNYITLAQARSGISVAGSLSYNSSTGVISYTTPTTSGITEGTNLYFTDSRARAALSVSGSLAYNSSTGVISYTTPSTSGISEGTNLYFTDSRARAALSASTGISYNSTTGAISSTITQYTDALARGAVSAAGSLSYNSTTGVFSYTTPTTSGITEGTNLYYTDARARAALSASTGISYNSSTGAISSTITQYTDALARAALSAGTGISYNSSTGAISSTITQYTDALARAAISVTGSGSYNSTTGVITVTGGVTSVNTRTGAITLSSSDVGLGSVENKSSATIRGELTSGNVTGALGFTPENSANRGVANGYASLNSSGQIPSTQLPSYVDDVVEGASLAAFPATGETGKIYVALDNNKTYRWSGSAYVYITSGAVDSVAGRTGIVTLTNTDVGLSSVENKSSATIRGEITSSNVTTALGFTPYNATNPSGYITNSALSSYLPLTGGTLSGNLVVNSSVSSQELLPTLGGSTYNWDGTSISYWWTRIANLSGVDGHASILITTKTDVNYVPYVAAILSIAKFNGTTISVKLDTLTSNDMAVNVRIDNNNDVWLQTAAEWSSYKNWRVLNRFGTITIYTSGLSEQLTTPANSVLIECGQRVRGSQGAMASATVESNAANIFGGVASRGAITQAGNQVLHAGNYNSYSPTLTGTGASGTWGISITGNAATATSATDSTKLPLTGGTATNVTLGVRVNNSTYGGNTTGMSAHSFPAEIRASGAKPTLTWHYESVATRHIALDGDGALNLYNPGESGGAVFKVGGNVALHAGNYNSYALPLSGGTLTGTLGSARNDNQRIIESYNTSAGSPTQFFIEHSLGGVNIGNARGNINISSGSLLHGSNQVLHAGNYTSYSPTLTGGSASGTWGISITGNSATVGGLAPAQFFNNMGNNHGTYTDFNSVPGFGAYYVQQGTNSPTGVAANQWYGFTLGLGNQYSLADYGTQIYWPRRAQNGDTYIYIRDREGGSWTSWTKVKAGYADTSGYATTAGSATDSSKLPLTGGSLSGNLSITPVSSSWAEGLAFEMPNTSTWGGLRWRRNRAGADGNWYIGFTALDSSDDLVFGANNGGAQIDNILRMTKAGVVTNNGNQILHAGNYGSYAVQHINGDSGAFNLNTSGQQSFVRFSTGVWVNPPIAGNYSHVLSVNAATDNRTFQIYMGDVPGTVYYRPCQAGTWHPWERILSSNNYNSYSPTLTGGGASGTWNIKSRSINAVRTSNTNFNDLSTALDTFTAGTNYIPSGGGYNQPVDGDHHYLAWGGIEGAAVWGAQIDVNFYDDRVWFRRQSGANWQAWRQFIHDGNYGNYALPLSGGAMSGNITFPNDSANGVFNAAGNAGYRPDDQYGNTYMFNTAGAGGWYGDFSSYYFRSSSSSNWLTISGSAVNSSVALQQSGNQVLHAGNYTNYVNAKGGSWYGSGLPGSRWGGYSTSGGEISFGDGLPNAGQMGILLDGCYVAGENNGFWSMGSDNTWGSRRGMYWDGSFLNFTTNTPTARFQNVQVDAQLTAANIAIGLGRSSLNAIGGNIGATTPSWNNSQLEIKNSDAGTVAISLHRAGYTSNTIDVRDGSGIRIDGNIALHAANFSSYALPLSGGTISGNQTITGNLTVSSGNTTGNGIILADDGDIVDLNDAYCSMRFSYGVRVFSANRGGSAVHTLHSNGTFTASGNVTAYSDERLKTDWTPVPENFVERLAKVKSGTYTRLDNNKRQAGSSAQDWQKLLPEVVSETDDEAKTLSLAYGNAALVSAVELAKEVTDLRARVAQLENLINKLILKD